MVEGVILMHIISHSQTVNKKEVQGVKDQYRYTCHSEIKLEE